MTTEEQFKHLLKWIVAKTEHSCDREMMKGRQYGYASNYGILNITVDASNGIFPSFEEYMQQFEPKPDQWVKQPDGSLRYEDEDQIAIHKTWPTGGTSYFHIPKKPFKIK